MRDLGEGRKRWNETLRHARGGVVELQRAVRYNGPESPCVVGSRAVCWKIFLLFESTELPVMMERLETLREDYIRDMKRTCKYFRYPEKLAKIPFDPLDDNPKSPWNIHRQDEMLRAEIAQDVERLPDEPFYHEEETQTMIINALFVYCKLHPNGGGYRQGMHEIFAPILYVLYQDALDGLARTPELPEEEYIVTMMDSLYLEHDAFAIFSKIMERAQAFYQVKDSIDAAATASASRNQAESSAIVEKSKFIHETCLAKVDPELARHLKDVEVLPQIFLIRWIRLLFGREFPFDQLLVFWDTLFAVDPELELIDYICVAMLIRIRWSLLEADYSHCLQLLLKYPAPSEHHGPPTFVEDAIYLQSNLHASGGASLIMKYTGKLPAESPFGQDTSHKEPSKGKGSPTRLLASRSPLATPAKFIQQQGGMEAIFQGAARNVLERGEKLGINQAVRDAVGEIKRNVQGFNEVRYSPRTARQALADDSASKAIAALEKRNRLLASMLDETIVNLRTIAGSDMEDKAKTLELVEMVAAKVQFVKVHLEDLTITVAEGEHPGRSSGEEKADVVMDDDEQLEADSVAEAITSLKIVDQKGKNVMVIETTPASPPAGLAEAAMDVTEETLLSPSQETKVASAPQAEEPVKIKEERPLPIPTRSTLAQSSFSWMLEPDETAPTAKTSQPLSPGSIVKGKGSVRGKRHSGNLSRERNAFLFGEVTADAEGADQPSAEDIFGMGPITRKDKRRSRELF